VAASLAESHGAGHGRSENGTKKKSCKRSAPLTVLSDRRGRRMGCGGSRDDEASLNSRRLDVQIAKDARVVSNDTKMLLLGPGESGKSTLFKQMKILAREGGYSEAELVRYKFRLLFCVLVSLSYSFPSGRALLSCSFFVSHFSF
jgi:hypothetical protein